MLNLNIYIQIINEIVTGGTEKAVLAPSQPPMYLSQDQEK